MGYIYFRLKEFRTALLLAAILLGGVSAAYITKQNHIRMADANLRAELTSRLGYVRARAESVVTSDLLLIHGVAAYIASNPKLTQEEFSLFASEILKQPNNLVNITASPDYVIRFVHPLTTNERLLGIDYRNLPDQWEKAQEVRRAKSLVVAGPIELIQGGQGLLGRAPVFVPGKGEERFWGMVSSVISVNRVIAQILDESEKLSLRIALRGVDGKGAQGDIFYGDYDLFTAENSIKMDIRIPNGSWQIAAVSSEPAKTIGILSDPLSSSIIVFTFFIFIFTYYKIKKDIALMSLKNALAFSQSMAHTGNFDWDLRSGRISGSDETLNILETGKNASLSLQEFIALAHPDDRNEIENIVFMKKSSESALIEHSFRIIPKKGVLKYINMRARYTEDEGIRRVNGAITDITPLKEIEISLQKSEARFRDFAHSSSDWIWETDTKGRFMFASEGITRILGYTPEEVIGKTPFDLMLPEEAEKISRILREKAHARLPVKDLENWNLTKKGGTVCLLTNGVPFTDDAGRHAGYRGVDKDITARKLAERELQKYIEIVDDNVIISQTDLNGTITYVSKALCRISGYSPEELLGKSHNKVRHPDNPPELFRDMWEKLEKNEPWHGEIKNLRSNGSYYWVSTSIYPVYDLKGFKQGYMAVRQDITDRKRIEEISVRDRLTGIFNRIKLDEILDREMKTALRYGTVFAAVIFDIDRFKSINDRFGHLVGDSVLKELACLVQGSIRAADVFGRWGGEEFLIICTATDKENAAILAENLRKIVESKNFESVGTVTCSFGVADSFGEESFESVLKKADKALYSAKEGGRNRVVTDGREASDV